jgi:ribose/xylose/arabinose/galactoside ABC-type transport system permease subunit
LKNKNWQNALTDQRIVIVILIIGVFLSLSSDYFLTFHNIVNIFLFISIEGVIAIGMAFLIILGEIDLSVGSNMALSGVLAILMQRHGVAPGVVMGVLGGTFIGFVNGMLVTKLRLTSIATTLGMMVMLNGVVFALTKSESVKGTNPAFLLISQSAVGGIPVPVIVLIALCVIFELVLQKTYFGRNVFAVGGNITASRFFGIKVDRVRILCFVITGLLSGIAGVVLASKINVASGRIGVNTGLLVITAVLLGGISLSGGEGSVNKAFQGILLIGILNNAMVLLRISPFIQDMIRGLLLIIMLIVDAVNIRRSKYV